MPGATASIQGQGVRARTKKAGARSKDPVARSQEPESMAQELLEERDQVQELRGHNQVAKKKERGSFS